MWHASSVKVSGEEPVAGKSAEEENWEYSLKCTADPEDAGAVPPEAGSGFCKDAVDYFDPEGLGEDGTLRMTLMGSGPHKGDISLSFTASVLVVATAKSPGSSPPWNWNKFLKTSQAEDECKMTIDPDTGHISYQPDPSVQKTGTGGQPALECWAQVSPSFQAAGYTQYHNGGTGDGSTATVPVGIASFEIPVGEPSTIKLPVRTLDWTITVVRRKKGSGGGWQSAPSDMQP